MAAPAPGLPRRRLPSTCPAQGRMRCPAAAFTALRLSWEPLGCKGGAALISHTGTLCRPCMLQALLAQTPCLQLVPFAGAERVQVQVGIQPVPRPLARGVGCSVWHQAPMILLLQLLSLHHNTAADVCIDPRSVAGGRHSPGTREQASRRGGRREGGGDTAHRCLCSQRLLRRDAALPKSSRLLTRSVILRRTPAVSFSSSSAAGQRCWLVTDSRRRQPDTNADARAACRRAPVLPPLSVQSGAAHPVFRQISRPEGCFHLAAGSLVAQCSPESIRRHA